MTIPDRNVEVYEADYVFGKIGSYVNLCRTEWHFRTLLDRTCSQHLAATSHLVFFLGYDVISHSFIHSLVLFPSTDPLCIVWATSIPHEFAMGTTKTDVYSKLNFWIKILLRKRESFFRTSLQNCETVDLPFYGLVAVIIWNIQERFRGHFLFLFYFLHSG